MKEPSNRQLTRDYIYKELAVIVSKDLLSLPDAMLLADAGIDSITLTEVLVKAEQLSDREVPNEILETVAGLETVNDLRRLIDTVVIAWRSSYD